jgi:REP element-mobilizing transposase RayT
MGHTFSNLLIHVIFSTKGRRPLIGESFRQRLYEYIAGIAREEFGKALEIGGTDNHLHALRKIRADVPVADAMRKWKSLSSGWIHKSFPGTEFEWQEGYSAFSVSESSSEKVVNYIKNQDKHHKKMTYEEEVLSLLKRHKIEYDPEHLWD